MNICGRKASRLAKAATFLVILGMLLALANAVLTPKWLTGLYHSTYTVTGFYNEPRKHIDVLFLGSSRIECSVSPLSLWHAHGITSYSLATPLQSPLVSYYYLREALRYQDVQIVVIEPKLLYREQAVDEHEDSYRNTLDYMPLSLNKLRAAADIVSYSQSQTLLSYALPLLRYHSRWSNLTAGDLQLNLVQEHSLKGFVPVYTKLDASAPQDDEESDTLSFTPFGEDYMNRIAALCKEHGVTLVLVQPPDIVWNQGMSSQIDAWAASWDLPFVDYNTPENLAALDLVEETDFFHPSHVNIRGAEKLTAHLGDYLAEHYALPDHRGDPAYSKWDTDYAHYMQQKASRFGLSSS
ncbi:MAG: hypothetical protein LLG44_01095 [Chloroflexi bacterium]|nr:hypothetical protein [Chloroflexota bacterium]